MDLNNRRIMFLRDRSGNAIGCVVISIDRNKKKAYFNISVQNPADTFNRKLARQLAIGRMIESPMTVALKKDATMHDVTAAVMLSIRANKDLPKRAVQAASNWLAAPLKVEYGRIPFSDDID
jgi:hypothetical protein